MEWREGRPLPEVSKVAANDELRYYVQDRLAVTITKFDGELMPSTMCVGSVAAGISARQILEPRTDLEPATALRLLVGEEFVRHTVWN